MNEQPTTLRYDDEIVRRFTLASVLWGVAGLLFGLLIALHLAFPALNLGLPYTSFGRLRPLHAAARRHLRLRRQHGVRRDVLLDAAAAQGPAGLPPSWRRCTSGAGSSSSCSRPSRCRSAIRGARNTPN
jgi:hypothetical protein